MKSARQVNVLGRGFVRSADERRPRNSTPYGQTTYPAAVDPVIAGFERPMRTV